MKGVGGVIKRRAISVGSTDDYETLAKEQVCARRLSVKSVTKKVTTHLSNELR